MSETVRANSRYGSLTGSHVIGRYPVERCHLHWPWVTLNRQRSIRHADSPGEGRVSRVQQIHPKRRGPSCATNFWGSLCTPSRSSNPRGRCPKISKFGALRIHPHGLTEKSKFATWPNYIGEGNLVYSYTPPPDAIRPAFKEPKLMTALCMLILFISQVPSLQHLAATWLHHHQQNGAETGHHQQT